ncbi:hypothetical protein [Pseudovibrio exalbescens]|uniref:Uncharacterized protein n=1 Tax=Pseudovibrio exalbescens TaxID=197461 RepID=A0A1U7JKP1_9HYPH|nr:hypothetical protein [Pseudovibrio exalbescens]OKL45211.1 hypothetical protein A3843_02370 [Pseudovibrio exalbescens]
MKAIISASLLLAAFWAFATPVHARDLLGKTLTHVWQEASANGDTIEKRFETFFCETDFLVWNDISQLADPEHHQAAYTMTEITPDITQVSWKDSPETSNLGYVWTLDFTTGKIFGVIINAEQDSNLQVEGTFEVLSGVTPSDGRKGCS